MRGNSRIEGTRPVRSRLPSPPSSRTNLDRDETRAGFLPSFRGFAGVGCNTRRPGGAERAALSLPVSSLDFRGERLRRPRRQAATLQSIVRQMSVSMNRVAYPLGKGPATPGRRGKSRIVAPGLVSRFPGGAVAPPAKVGGYRSFRASPAERRRAARPPEVAVDGARWRKPYVT